MSDVIGSIDYGDRGTVQIVEDADALAQQAAEMFISTVRDAVDRSGTATVALSGGSTPRQMGQLLAREGYRERVPWEELHVFWGDERWVPLDAPESNAGEAKRAFLDLVGIPAANVHPFETEGLSPEESASHYESLIRSVVESHVGTPAFDLILLGMGDDGHTASLFPGTDAISERDRLVVSQFVPKLNTTRLTMTPPLLNAGHNVVFLAAGAGKASRLADVLDRPIDVDRLPAQVIRPKAGGPVWLVDVAAAASLFNQPE
jgi:6-phosphogluconolactonase